MNKRQKNQDPSDLETFKGTFLIIVFVLLVVYFYTH
jgi:hypothetical protein